MNISASMVKELREKTGAGIMECKEALKDSEGDIESAIDLIRKKGLSDASKRSERATGEGVIASYVHPGDKIGVLVEVNCETDFVARNTEFRELVKDIAMQIAAARPLYLSRDEIPENVLEKEKEIFTEQARQSGKPEQVIEKIVEGKLEKYYKETCLLDQSFIKDPDVNISDLISLKISKTGENISVRRFTRYSLGEEA